MPEVRSISPVQYAVYGGETCRAEGRVPADVQLYRDGAPWKQVPIADLDEWYTIRTWGTFLEHEFEIYREGEDRYGIGVVGTGDGHWLAATWANPEEHPEVQFDRQDMFTFFASVPKHMVTDLREVRTDHLEPKESDDR